MDAMNQIISVILWIPRLIRFVNEVRSAWNDVKESDTFKRIVAEAYAARDSFPSR